MDDATNIFPNAPFLDNKVGFGHSKTHKARNSKAIRLF